VTERPAGTTETRLLRVLLLGLHRLWPNRRAVSTPLLVARERLLLDHCRFESTDGTVE